MHEKEWYKEWFSSPYYDILYKERDDIESTNFVRSLVKHLGIKPEDRVLDAACGKGHHSRLLAELGFDVAGIDISESSIIAAKKFENDNLEFYLHDMRMPFRINYFDYAFNFFTSFGHFHSGREHDSVVRTIAQSLHCNGIFTIDYLNVHFNEEHIIRVEEKTTNGVHFNIARWHDEDHFYKRIEIEDANNNETKHLFTEKIEKFSLGDFTDMLAYHGLMVQEVFGNYDLSPYHVRKTPRMIILAKKLH